MLRATVSATMALCVFACGAFSVPQPASSHDIAQVKTDFADRVFTFQTITGIGKEPGITRRDPSDVIRVGDTHFVYYTHVDQNRLAPENKRLKASGYVGTIWYATSEDEGHHWTEQGPALGTGLSGAFDSFAVFTPNIVKFSGKYWLYYTGVKATPGQSIFENNSVNDVTALGVAVSASPHGPFTRLGRDPILAVTPQSTDPVRPSRFDSFRIDDASLLVRDHDGDGDLDLWLYYKGRNFDHGRSGPGKTQMGLAIADTPVGPYTRANDGHPILSNSHEVMIWPHRGGVAAYASASRTLEFASDGVDFMSDPLHMPTANKPIAPGCFRTDLITPDDFGQGIQWGICMRDPGGPAPYLVRYSLAHAEEAVSPPLKTISFHGIYATDPGGRLGLRNPERGLRYEARIGNDIGRDNNHMDWIRAMQRFEPDGMTLSQTYCYLDGFVDKPLSQEKLDWLQRDFDLMRKYGFKCLLRFAYQHGDVKGPEKKWVLHHIEQLKPLIAKNSDVIFILQAGFIGMWGEWHGDTHNDDYEARADILAKVLELLPQDRFTQVRVPLYKLRIIPRLENRRAEEVDERLAFTLKPEARIGFNNDGVLAGPSHGGTWPQEPHFGSEENRLFARATRESAWVPTEGEMFWSDQAWDGVEATGKGVDGFNAIKFLRLQHYVSFSLAHSYSEFQGKPYCMDRWRTRTLTAEKVKAENLPLSDGYFDDVYGHPVARTEYDYLRDHLGYRLELQEVRLTENVKPGETLRVELELINRGFSTVFNPRQPFLVLISEDEKTFHEIPLDANPRDWQPFHPADPNYESLRHKIRYEGQLSVDIKPGKYRLGLWLPDPKPAIRLDPQFAVRLANRDTPWWTSLDGKYGVNILHTIQVTEK